MRNNYSIDPSKLGITEWLSYILSDEDSSQLYYSRCFPSLEHTEEFIKILNTLDDRQIKTILRRFLIKTGYSQKDIDRLEFFKYQDKFPDINFDDLLKTEYYRRLLSDEDLAWEGVSWVIDLLPDHPKMAIDTLNAYSTAHLNFMSDMDILGLSDAQVIIRSKYINYTQPRETFLDLHPRDFEHLVDALYEAMGYDTTITPYIRDGGKDIIAISSELGRTEKILIECKRYEPDIGPDKLRALYGVVHSDKASRGVLVTSSNFTNDAKDYAVINGIELINHLDLTRLLNSYLGSNWVFYLDRIINTRKNYNKTL